MRPVQKRVHDPSAPSNERLVGEIFSGTKYKVTYEASMGDYLLCRAAFWLAHRGKMPYNDKKYGRRVLRCTN